VVERADHDAAAARPAHALNGRRRTLLALTLALAPALAAAQAPEPAAATPGELEVVGAVRRPLRLSREALARWDEAQQSQATVTRRCDGGERSTTVCGVRLAALLDVARLDERDRLDWRKTVVLATAADGYRVVFAWPELVNTEAGRQGIVVHERDGGPLDPREGPVSLHAPGDLRSGPRPVWQLVRLEVWIPRE